jgi:hypothetical protein
MGFSELPTTRRPARPTLKTKCSAKCKVQGWGRVNWARFADSPEHCGRNAALDVGATALPTL